MKTVYLSSTNYEEMTPKDGVYFGDRHWRDIIKQHLSSYKFIEPIFSKNPSVDVVEEDKKNIRDSDILLAYIIKKTCGTSMEILYAYEQGKDVYVIDRDGIVKNDPWIIGHTHDIFKNFVDCEAAFKFKYETDKIIRIPERK